MFGFLKKKKNKKVEVETVQVVVKEEKIIEQKVETEVKHVEKDSKPVLEEEPKRKRKAVNHITKHKDGGWQIKKEGAQRAQRKFDTQKEAIDFAKGLEKTTGTAYIIHKANGSTRKKTY